MTEQIRRRIIELRKQGMSVRKIQRELAEIFDWTTSTSVIQRVLTDAAVPVPEAYQNSAKTSPPAPAVPTEIPVESAEIVSKGKEDECELQVFSIKPCMTIDEAIRAAGADPREWEVSETRIRTSTIKMKEDGVEHR